MTTMLSEPMAPWVRELNRVFGGGGVNAFIPATDVRVTEEDVTVYMDVPGVDREDLEIELENEVLTIRGERRPPYEQEDGRRTWQRIERGFGAFERDIRVPRGLDPDSIEASLANGVLALRIPKPEPLKPRRIEIAGRDESEEQQLEGATEDTATA